MLNYLFEIALFVAILLGLVFFWFEIWLDKKYWKELLPCYAKDVAAKKSVLPYFLLVLTLVAPFMAGVTISWAVGRMPYWKDAAILFAPIYTVYLSHLTYFVRFKIWKDKKYASLRIGRLFLLTLMSLWGISFQVVNHFAHQYDSWKISFFIMFAMPFLLTFLSMLSLHLGESKLFEQDKIDYKERTGKKIYYHWSIYYLLPLAFSVVFLIFSDQTKGFVQMIERLR